jgi:hypothetical protein
VSDGTEDDVGGVAGGAFEVVSRVGERRVPFWRARTACSAFFGSLAGAQGCPAAGLYRRRPWHAD